MSKLIELLVELINLAVIVFERDNIKYVEVDDLSTRMFEDISDMLPKGSCKLIMIPNVGERLAIRWDNFVFYLKELTILQTTWDRKIGVDKRRKMIGLLNENKTNHDA